MSKNRRTEAVNVKFVNRKAEGWIFGVPDAFRSQLDIKLDERIDKEANKKKETALGRKLEPSEKLKRRVWTQGAPPEYAFDRGHTFHELADAQPGIRRSITVVRAKPDAGALVESRSLDELGEESIAIVESESDKSGGGWVDYEVLTYKNGTLVTYEDGFAVKEKSSRSQAAFAELLRTGK
jgi:hypothetical protein